MDPIYNPGDVAPLTGKVGCIAHPKSGAHVFLGARFARCSHVDESELETACAWQYLWALRSQGVKGSYRRRGA
jgi:hypothetical protein